jgi:hypothetical protein
LHFDCAGGAAPGRGERFWTGAGRAIARRPALVLVATAVLMAPFAVVAVTHPGAVNFEVDRECSRIILQRI